MTGTDVLKESIRCQCSHCKEEAMANEIVALRAERDKLAARLEAAIELEAEVSGANRRLRAERDALRKVDDTMVIRFLAGYTMCEDESSVEFSHSAAVRAGLVAALSALEVQP